MASTPVPTQKYIELIEELVTNGMQLEDITASRLRTRLGGSHPRITQILNDYRASKGVQVAKASAGKAKARVASAGKKARSNATGTAAAAAAKASAVKADELRRIEKLQKDIVANLEKAADRLQKDVKAYVAKTEKLIDKQARQLKDYAESHKQLRQLIAQVEKLAGNMKSKDQVVQNLKSQFDKLKKKVGK
jgi:predicted RNase H-like nuclease (RuvC/YqgF family)